MHPAPSIIVFTTLSGLGYGLAAVLGLGLLDPAALATKLAYLLAFALIAGGLVSSTLHLGNPQRAWRALTQWRSSWLSREGVLAILTFAPLSVAAIAALWSGRHIALVGLIGTALAMVTVYCTAMIYASLKSVQAWHTPLTAACYLLFSASGGLVAGAAFAAAGGSDGLGLILLLALVALAAAWVAKLSWWRRLAELKPLSTPESATGLGFIGRVRLLERPHVNENYLTSEMGFRVARKHAQKLARIAFAAGGVVPAADCRGAADPARRAGLGGGAAAVSRRAQPPRGRHRRALAVLRRSAACRDELLRRLSASDGKWEPVFCEVHLRRGSNATWAQSKMPQHGTARQRKRPQSQASGPLLGAVTMLSVWKAGILRMSDNWSFGDLSVADRQPSTTRARVNVRSG